MTVGRIVAICASEGKGTPKTCRDHAVLVAGSGMAGDAHAGPGLRQISILALERIDAFRRAGAEVRHGDFGENLVVEGIDLERLKVGDLLECGAARLELSQFGKECHSRCRIYEAMGDCIMPRHGVFAIVAAGGEIRVGDAVRIVAGEKA